MSKINWSPITDGLAELRTKVSEAFTPDKYKIDDIYHRFNDRPGTGYFCFRVVRMYIDQEGYKHSIFGGTEYVCKPIDEDFDIVIQATKDKLDDVGDGEHEAHGLYRLIIKDGKLISTRPPEKYNEDNK